MTPTMKEIFSGRPTFEVIYPQSGPLVGHPDEIEDEPDDQDFDPYDEFDAKNAEFEKLMAQHGYGSYIDERENTFTVWDKRHWDETHGRPPGSFPVTVSQDLSLVPKTMAATQVIKKLQAVTGGELRRIDLESPAEIWEQAGLSRLFGAPINKRLRSIASEYFDESPYDARAASAKRWGDVAGTVGKTVKRSHLSVVDDDED